MNCELCGYKNAVKIWQRGTPVYLCRDRVKCWKRWDIKNDIPSLNITQERLQKGGIIH